MGFENFSEQNTEQTPEQIKLEVLKDDLIFILSNLDSNITEDFFGYFKEEKIDVNKYSLGKAFIAIMSGSPLPEQSPNEPFDTDDQKIEGYIKSMAENLQKIAA